MNKIVSFIAFALCLFASTAASAATTLSVDFSLPEFAKEDYRKPYVAMWSEHDGESDNLLIWHLTKHDNDKWLVDMRRWWRKEGRYADNKFDGITGATKSSGKHQVQLDVSKLSEFTLFIEVARQKGGRSIIRQKINLNGDQKQFNIAATSELGAVTIKVNN
jgi:hypothetical protein